MWCNEWKTGCVITLKVTPKASRNTVLGAEDSWLRVALTAPPVDGKANEAARRFLAEMLNVSKSSVTLLAGQTARLKRFAVADVSPDVAIDKLLS
ncbi:MAG: DUF167 domain-containing protein [Kiritimatiellae bacterium]|nr:DUF167 domain-containing protein [Kiritimatiellia bacterium]